VTTTRARRAWARGGRTGWRYFSWLSHPPSRPVCYPMLRPVAACRCHGVRPENAEGNMHSVHDLSPTIHFTSKNQLKRSQPSKKHLTLSHFISKATQMSLIPDSTVEDNTSPECILEKTR
jgi:hypothetical protein